MGDDWENERPAFIAGEVRRAAMAEYLEKSAVKWAAQSTKARCAMRLNWLWTESYRIF